MLRFASVLMLPFGKHVNGAFLVAQHDRPEVDLLDQAADAVDRRDVADADLILEDHEEAADDVAHERLCAEADGEPGDAGAGQDGRDVDVEFVEDHHQGDAADADRARPVDERSQSPRAFCTLERVDARPQADLVFESSNEQRDEPDQRVGQEDYQEDIASVAECRGRQRAERQTPARPHPGELERREQQQRRGEREDRERDEAQRSSHVRAGDREVIAEDGIQRPLASRLTRIATNAEMTSVAVSAVRIPRQSMVPEKRPAFMGAG